MRFRLDCLRSNRSPFRESSFDEWNVDARGWNLTENNGQIERVKQHLWKSDYERVKCWMWVRVRFHLLDIDRTSSSGTTKRPLGIGSKVESNSTVVNDPLSSWHEFLVAFRIRFSLEAEAWMVFLEFSSNLLPIFHPILFSFPLFSSLHFLHWTFVHSLTLIHYISIGNYSYFYPLVVFIHFTCGFGRCCPF